jgi:hypothetical protein
MAEEGKASQSTPVPQSSPEPDLDALLSKMSIPELKKAFGPPPTAGSGTDTTEQNSAPPTETEEGTAPVPDEIGLPPAEPIEEEPESAPAGSEEEPEPEAEPKFELPESVQKRIDQLTAKRKVAEEQVATLAAENAALKAKAVTAPPVMPTAASPLADIETHEALGQKLALAQQAKSWAIENLEGGNVDMGGGKVEYLDAANVRKLLAKAEELLTLHGPQRARYITDKGQFDAEARRDYPALFKPGTPEHTEYNTWLSVFPECRKYADIALIVGDAIVGRTMRLARRQKGQQKGNGQSPPLATPAPSGAPRVAKPRTLSSEELSAIATDPSSKALDKFVDQLIEGGRQAQAAHRQRSQR